MSQQLEGSGLAVEAALMGRVARGEGDAVEAFVRVHGGPLLRFVYRRSGEQYEEAQDITQETLLAALKLAGSFDGSCSIMTWLCSLAKIKIADHIRRQSRQKRIPASKLIEFDAAGAQALDRFHRGEIEVDQVLDILDSRVFIDGVTAHLSDDEREALTLHYVEGFSIEEMTRLLHRSAKGVESLLTRAKRRCREVAAGWLTA